MSNDWWAKKLGVPPGQVNRDVANTRIPMTPQSPAFHVSPVENTPPVKAQSAKRVDFCPECNSENYMKPPTGNSGLRCFDCGYPVVQSGSGVSGVKSEGPVRPARQVSTANNFNPTVIVGRIG